MTQSPSLIAVAMQCLWAPHQSPTLSPGSSAPHASDRHSVANATRVEYSLHQEALRHSRSDCHARRSICRLFCANCACCLRFVTDSGHYPGRRTFRSELDQERSHVQDCCDGDHRGLEPGHTLRQERQQDRHHRLQRLLGCNLTIMVPMGWSVRIEFINESQSFRHSLMVTMVYA